MTKMPGFFTLYRDGTNGKLWLEIDRWNKEFLLVNYLSGGVGSNDIGLDRGQISGEYVVYWRRVGPKVLLIQAVRESFAESVLWSFQVEAESGQHVLVDATDFFVRDSRNISNVLRRTGQGNYVFNRELSALNDQRTRNFPFNTEVDALVTLTGTPKGGWIRDVTPTPENVTVYEHTSFVKLPDEAYNPRKFDPRSGYFPMVYSDYSTPFDQSPEQRFIFRHRLQKKNPDAAISDPVEPIVYYVDNSAPEPIRSALIEGASWWNEAFEAAGFRNAFQVKVLPDTADPLDIRFNVIQWVHRATRGWSYGSTVADPRTGEIIKGHVSLGSLRIRQDYLIGKALKGPYSEDAEQDSEIEKMALARIRQLACHEVGHTLGLAHNYAASTYGRGSVMDYPHPLIRLNSQGEIDFTDAYAVGVGSWDKVTIRYGYTDFGTSGDEDDLLRSILNEAIDQGVFFLSDQDARPRGSASPTAHLWDNGPDPVLELQNLMKVRRVALERFGENSLRVNEPLALLGDILVPLYLLPRYQIEAVSKLIGGVTYRYNLKGDTQILPEPVDPARQMSALRALLDILDPENLVLPEQLLKIIPPRPLGYPQTRESFQGYTDPVFDPLAPATSLCEITLAQIFQPERVSRMIRLQVLNAANPDYEKLIEDVFSRTWYAPHPVNGYPAQILQMENRIVLEKMLLLLDDENADPAVREITWDALNTLKNKLEKKISKEASSSRKAQYRYAVALLGRELKDGLRRRVSNPGTIPPGQPIGME